MKISPLGLDLIKKFEGLRLRSYLCPAGVWTIGYGTTGPNIKSGMTITKAEAEKFLAEDCVKFERGVENACKPAVPNQAEFDAMVSFAYNCGLANFKKSSILRHFKAGNKAAAAESFKMWVKARNPKTGKLEPLPGLVRRRAAEAHLFLASGSPRTVKRSTGAQKTISVPETSVVPEAPKSLVKSREIIGGGVAGVGGITQIIDAITIDDAEKAQAKLKTIKEQPQSSFVKEWHITEIASVLIVVVALFIIWKRIKDRKEGIR